MAGAQQQWLERVAGAAHAYLATVRPDGRPHVVPITFALSGTRLFTPVDHKPKRTGRLQRLANIHTNPAVSVLADHYEEDWTRLWWVRVDGTAHIVDDAGQTGERGEAIACLQRRYPQYRERPPEGPVIVVAVERVSGWQADPAQPGS